MAYAESSSYITHAEWGSFVGADVIAALVASESSGLVYRNAASGVVDEYATSAGLATPLGSEHLTYSMKRRVALIAAHMASDAHPEHRNAEGRSPYHAQRDEALNELREWKAGVRSMPGDAEADPVRADTFCVTNRRRNWTRGR